MVSYSVTGTARIHGRIECQGSKNSALPILAASYMVKGRTEIHNCPCLSDVDATLRILESLGCAVTREGKTVIVDSTDARGYEISRELMHEMRSSIIFLGAILGRAGRAVLSTPGGCEIGLRPIDLHLSAMRSFGVSINEEHGRLDCLSTGRLHGTDITLHIPSVGATENIMLAAVCANGTTRIINAAREPEISDLAAFLNACGAKISGCGEGVITVRGVDSLTATSHRVIPDRIVCATYLCAAAITGGSVTVTNADSAHLATVLPLLTEMGCFVNSGESEVSLDAPPRLRRAEKICTQPYPGFPTDLQALFTALACTAHGTTVIVENIFESRFKHIPQLIKMGAKIRTQGQVAIVDGVPELFGADVSSPDLRAGCALVLAGLRASGITNVSDIYHIERGYDGLENALRSLGADMTRID